MKDHKINRSETKFINTISNFWEHDMLLKASEKAN